MTQLDIREFLIQQGYPVLDRGEYINTAALWREGRDETSVAVYPKTNTVIDFPTGERFTIDGLVSRILGIDSKFGLKTWLATNGMELKGANTENPTINVQKVFNDSELKEWLPDYSYLEGRGILAQTQKIFEGGLCVAGKLKNRFCFPIRNGRGQIIGVTGRSVNNSKPKWKHCGGVGSKKTWIWPVFYTLKDIQAANQIILVESPACVLKLYQCGIKHAVCLFGVELSTGLLNFCIKMSPQRIIIATNNEQSGIGNAAAEKVYKKLRKFFDRNQVAIKLPLKKDFGEMSQDEILSWYGK